MIIYEHIHRKNKKKKDFYGHKMYDKIYHHKDFAYYDNLMRL